MNFPAHYFEFCPRSRPLPPLVPVPTPEPKKMFCVGWNPFDPENSNILQEKNDDLTVFEFCVLKHYDRRVFFEWGRGLGGRGVGKVDI